MNEINLRDKLCSCYCPYYKPSGKEELACKGFLVVERFINSGKEIPFIKSGKIPDESIQNILIQHLCITCSFYENDCDFAQHMEGALPCGGFSLLGMLIEENILTIDNMKDIH